MKDYSMQNKKAWEYSAYEFWISQNGTPQELAEKILENSMGFGTLSSHARKGNSSVRLS